MKEQFSKLGLGMLSFIAALLLASTPVYTSVKGIIIDIGGSVSLAISVAWLLIAFALTTGMILFKQA